MYDDKKLLALIPARGGSKGIKNKNIIDLLGKPLIAYTIEAAKQSKYIDSVIVSTDSDQIANVSREYGAEIPFMRPSELASDYAKTIDAVIHAINTLASLGKNFDTLILLQPTQPLRDNIDIDCAIEKYFADNEEDLVSVSEVEENPVLLRIINDENRLDKFLKISSTCRRQDMPKYYKVNGCIYINAIRSLSNNTSFNDNTNPYIMKSEKSVDIDELKDLKIAEYYLKGDN